MNLKTLTKLLQKVLDSDQTRAAKQEAAIRDLIATLRQKEAKYQAKIPLATTEKEIKKLKRHLAVCQAQIAKGQKALGA